MQARVLDGEIINSRLEDGRVFDGVLSKRVFAFVIDYLIVLALLVPVGIAVFILGLLTFGIAWSLFGVLFPAVALAYVWNTMGSPRQATIGMRAMGIRIERLDGRPVDGLTAIVHSVLFWAANVILTPFVLLVTLFTARRQALHDLLLGTVITRSDR